MIRHPTFKPHWTPFVIPQTGVVLLSSDEQRLLNGGSFADLTLLLDGMTCVDDVIAALCDRHDIASLYFCLMQMENAGYLTDGPPETPPSLIVWTESGARLVTSGPRPTQEPDETRAADSFPPEATGAVSTDEGLATANPGGDPPRTPPSHVDGPRDERFASMLERIKPALHDTLVPASSFDKMLRVANLLPREFSEFWGIECRLDQTIQEADILFSVYPRTAGASLLAGAQPSCLDDLCEASPVWRALRTLARHWQRPDHPERLRITGLWLEHDTAAVRCDADLLRSIRQPNVFVAPSSQATADEIIRLTGILSRFFESARGSLPALRWFMDALPPGARLVWIGWMMTRDPACGLRLCISGVDPAALRPWLSAILPRHVDELMPLIDLLTPLCRSLVFCFNLTARGVDPDLGVECYIRKVFDESAEWMTLLRTLEDAGIPVLEHWQAVDDYVGTLAIPLQQRLHGDRLELNPIRCINHVKCRLSKAKIAQVKVYLAASHREVHLEDIKLASGLSMARDSLLGSNGECRAPTVR